MSDQADMYIERIERAYQEDISELYQQIEKLKKENKELREKFERPAHTSTSPCRIRHV